MPAFMSLQFPPPPLGRQDVARSKPKAPQGCGTIRACSLLLPKPRGRRTPRRQTGKADIQSTLKN